ncbi:SusC/RagA family TonB-linked outer membrane protein [Solitalea lacus]|uniref:SusC/RagA family TonB-linked outer membrane protein n=1 Tax=Solitalea lacus TaxID=2911172 RepID=UPI001EDA9009|nr:TonB-dependent receptor [Solitalea lacus]UKJ08897.1 TonB-dependent receptor [Solitalea lacus]
MRTKTTLKLLVLLVSVCGVQIGSINQLYGQSVKQTELTVKGKVTDEKGEELPGATVLIKGTSKGTTTDVSGSYTIAASAGNTLSFSFTGFVTREVTIGNNAVINVQLKSDSKALEEIVVVGYGTKKKVTVTGSVATVKGGDIKQSPSANISNSLAGRAPGVIASNRSGEPGNDFSTLLIRGKGTLNDNSPLIVIDGVANRGSFERLNPDDVESISVLKDASAAIYGAQAANGVILVTTKKGKSGKPVIAYSGSYGTTQPTQLPNSVNAGQYATYINEVNDRYGKPHQYTEADIQKYYNGSDPVNYPNTNWYDAVIKDNSLQSRHALSVSGGNEKTDFFLSGEYLNQDGIYRNSSTDYKQYNLRTNVNTQILPILKVAFNLSGRLEDRDYSNYSSNNIFAEVLSAYPTLPAYYPNGLPGPGLSGGRNPVLMASGATGYNYTNDYNLLSDLSFDIKLPFITEGLYVAGLAAYDFRFRNEKIFKDNWDAYRYNRNTNEYENLRNSIGPINLRSDYRNYQMKTYNIKLGYNRVVGNHDIGAFVAYEQSDSYNEGIFAYRTGYLSNKIDQIFIGADKDKDNGGNAAQTARQNLFGRLSYGYKQKYLIDLVLRHDGSYIFPKDKRWGTFPGVSAAWRVSEEAFFKNNVHFVDQFKLKASWAELGNDKVLPYQNIQQYYLDGGYYFGSEGALVQGLSAGVTPNPNITWEVARTSNFGFESTFWNGLLTLNADYFISNRNNILVARNASVPSSTGLNGKLPAENIGRVNNSGIELEISHQRAINENFSYNIGANYTYTKNEVKFMDEPANVPEWQKRQGFPMDSWLVYKTDGIYRTQAEIDNSVHLPNTRLGDLRYVDINGDKQITSNDRIRVYEGPTPRGIYGITLGLNYKGIGLNMLWQGQTNAQQLILPQQGNAITPPKWLFEDRWTTSNPNGSYPASFDRNDAVNNRYSDFWLRNAAFIRLKNVELSYTLPKSLTQSLHLQNARVFVNGFNLLTFSDIKDYDPELNNVTGSYYPQTRIISAGVNISL